MKVCLFEFSVILMFGFCVDVSYYVNAIVVRCLRFIEMSSFRLLKVCYLCKAHR